MSSVREASPIALGATYVANFGALAVYGPFLALYLAHRGLSTEAVAQLLAVTLLLRVVASPSWTILADALQSTVLVLRIVSVGAAASFALLLHGGSAIEVVVVLLLFAVFRAPCGSLVDALVLRWSSRTGRPFGALRVWGTVGYTCGAYGAGLAITHFGESAIAIATTALLALGGLFSFTLPVGGVVTERPHLARPLAILMRRPRFLILLGTVMLHQIGLAPYDNLFPAYLTKISGASYAGASIAVGAGAELVFMITCSHLIKRIGPARVLVFAYAVSAVRWALIAFVTDPYVLVAVQLLHAIGFGAFYLSAVALVDEDAPNEVRASAQGVFGAIGFGVAAAIGLSIAGFVERAAGMRGVFIVSTFAATLAALLALVMTRMPSFTASTPRTS